MDDKVEEQNKFDLHKAAEWIGFLGALIAFLSVLSSIVIKYISFGRCLFFDFDLNYYDFSLSNTSKFVFILSLIAGIISAILCICVNQIWNKFSEFMENKSHKYAFKVIAGIILCFFYLIFIVILSKLFIPQENIVIMFGSMVIIFSIIIYEVIWSIQTDFSKGKAIKAVLAIVCIILLFLMPTCMRNEYNDAKKQREFSIVINKVHKQLQYYVVISQSKQKYSAYLCNIEERDGKGKLSIITDVHKYFNINSTETVTVRVDKIKRVKMKPLTVKKFINYSNKILKQKVSSKRNH